MSQLPSVFNAEKHSGRMGFNTIPKGKYKAQIVKSEMKKTREGNGQMLVLMFKVSDGQHKGAVIFRRLNLVNQNDMAVTIAQNELATICDAIGKKAVKDSEELHAKEMWIDVVVKDADGDYPASNDITNYTSLSKGGTSTAAAKSDDEDADDAEEEAPKPKKSLFGNKK